MPTTAVWLGLHQCLLQQAGQCSPSVGFLQWILGPHVFLALICTKQQPGVADSIHELDRLFAAALHTLHLDEAKRERLGDDGLKVRPLPPGAYLGLGSQI